MTAIIGTTDRKKRRIQTTLYDLIGSINTEVPPADDDLVVRAAVNILDRGGMEADWFARHLDPDDQALQGYGFFEQIGSGAA
jgi:hypothetical protein